jgi:hypothetical protein
MCDNNRSLRGIGDGDCPTPPAPKPLANECSATTPTPKINFKIYSHNINGLRDESKIEYIPRIMKKNNIDAYLTQETHLAGDFEKNLILDH